MFRTTLLAACVTSLVAVAGTASAQGFRGATVALEYNDTTSNTYYLLGFEGRLAYDFGGGFGLQLDGYNFRYEPGPEGHGITLHAYYDVTPALTVGLYHGRETWDGRDNYDYTGLEAIYHTQEWSMEGYIGQYSFGGRDETYYGLLTSFDLTGNLELLASVEGWDYIGGTWANYTIGARYTFDNGAFVEGRLGRLEDSFGSTPRDLVSITFGFNLGEGAVFTRRDYVAVTDGW